MPDGRIRVVVFESSRMAGELLSHALERSGYGLQVVCKAESFADGEQSALAEADVALISANLRDGPLAGFTVLRDLIKTYSRMRCILLLNSSAPDLVLEGFRSGAVGVCERTQPCEMICKCVHCVHHGQVWANSQQLRYVLKALHTQLPRRITNVKGELLLTWREDEIASLVAQGLRNREIAEALKLSESTVKHHLFHIFDRLGISSRSELILYLLSQADARQVQLSDLADVSS
jgi:DNA-binding NarL/FixJ family response regulator